MMVDRSDINHPCSAWAGHSGRCVSARRSCCGTGGPLQLPARHALVMGNALVARLLHSLAQRAT
jgi:hypothetical protein